MYLGEQTTEFIDFPPRQEILQRLRGVDDSAVTLEVLYEDIAERLGDRTYERSASAFILIEMVYDFEETYGNDMSPLLPRYILSLTDDRDLALSALSAFNEIKDAIRIEAPDVEPPPAAEPAAEEGPAEPAEAVLGAAGEEEPETGAASPVAVSEAERQADALFGDEGRRDADIMMTKLQASQKALSDLGLSTRVSIDMGTRRPTRERVSRSLQDISALRTALRRFEELLSQAEVQVLEVAGLLLDEESDRRE